MKLDARLLEYAALACKNSADDLRNVVKGPDTQETRAARAMMDEIAKVYDQAKLHCELLSIAAEEGEPE